MKKFSVSSALVSGAVVASAAVIGSAVTTQSVNTWYPLLNKSPLNPPSWVFGPVWTVLFALMAVAFYQILTANKSKKRSEAIRLFCYQLIVNVLWSGFFFGLRAPLTALFVLNGLWFCILATMIGFARVRASAAWLLLPYIVWVTFAGYLNYMVYVLN